ncbi:CBS domain-containing protein [Nocardioides aquiterrae]|uniref:CBS domain-containing protein n=1 Tax=Nocardioides aquiterrae TaxID=203799 RepID=A0ABP4ET91_9ACTN
MTPGRVVTVDPACAADRVVADVVVRRPTTLDAATSVRAARTQLEDEHVHMVLLTRNGVLLGTLVRADLATADDAAPALAHAVLAGRTIAPTVTAEEALRELVARDERRRAVVTEDGRLVGLLCLKRRRTGFCRDRDVAARRAGLDALATAFGGFLP